MFVLTADQIGSRSSADAVDVALETIWRVGRARLALPPERTVGDEVQVATNDPRCLLDLVLALTRLRKWSVGCGIGDVETQLPTSVRAARGPAFTMAREAVDASKKRQLRFAVRASNDRADAASDAQAVIDLLLALRSRRTPEGWEVFDLLESGLAQKAVAKHLGISEQAVSARARAAHVATELAAVPALARALDRVERGEGERR
jgi:hypothetical protein